MPKRYRKRREESDEEERKSGGEDEGEDVSKKLEEAKVIQKFRKRPAGVSAVGLAFGSKFTEDEKLAPDPFKLKTGGLVDLQTISEAEAESTENEVVKRLASTFSAETNTRDDETQMLQYIEEQMAKKRGVVQEEDKLSSFEAKVKELYKVSDRLDVKEKTRTEEMLSNQMLSGIPEVDLGLEAKFSNIEETESAKQKLMEEQRKGNKKKASFAPSNMAVNYTLHSLRFFKHKDHSRAAATKKVEKEPPQPTYVPVVGDLDEPELKPTNVPDSYSKKEEHTSMATDDFHYDRFRKRVKRF